MLLSVLFVWCSKVPEEYQEPETRQFQASENLQVGGLRWWQDTWRGAADTFVACGGGMPRDAGCHASWCWIRRRRARGAEAALGQQMMRRALVEWPAWRAAAHTGLVQHPSQHLTSADPSAALLPLPLQWWLTDKRGRDQFVARYGEETDVYWNDPARQQPDEVGGWVQCWWMGGLKGCAEAACACTLRGGSSRELLTPSCAAAAGGGGWVMHGGLWLGAT